MRIFPGRIEGGDGVKEFSVSGGGGGTLVSPVRKTLYLVIFVSKNKWLVFLISDYP